MMYYVGVFMVLNLCNDLFLNKIYKCMVHFVFIQSFLDRHVVWTGYCRCTENKVNNTPMYFIQKINHYILLKLKTHVHNSPFIINLKSKGE